MGVGEDPGNQMRVTRNRLLVNDCLETSKVHCCRYFVNVKLSPQVSTDLKNECQPLHRTMTSTDQVYFNKDSGKDNILI